MASNIEISRCSGLDMQAQMSKGTIADLWIQLRRGCEFFFAAKIGGTF